MGGRRLIVKRFSTIYWTPCVAHCIDSLFYHIGKLTWVNEVIWQARTISNFMVSHLTSTIYRKHSSRELLRPCDSRFATFFITLKWVFEEKSALRIVICSVEWEISFSKGTKVKHVESIILETTFWESSTKVLKLCEPIVDMLRKLDSGTYSMSFVYEGWIVAKKPLSKHLIM